MLKELHTIIQLYSHFVSQYTINRRNEMRRCFVVKIYKMLHCLAPNRARRFAGN